MPTPKKGPRLGGGPAHERLILANLATALFEHDSITTTEAKAKRLRPLAERLVTFAKRGDLHARRRVMTVVRDKGVVHRLFVEIAPDMAERQGGYTRITKIAPRKGDNAPMAVIELVREPVSAKPKRAVVAEAEGATKRAAKEKKAKDAPVAAAPVEDVVVEDMVAEDVPVAEAEVQDAPVVADAPVVEDASAPVVAEDAAVDSAAPAASQNAPVADLTDAEPVAATQAAALGEVAEAPADGSQPVGFDIKGNKDSMLYHVPGSQWYDATEAEVWFDTADAAEKAGFQPAGGAEKQQVDEA